MLEQGGASLVRPHPAVRTLLRTKGEITAVLLDQRTWARHALGGAAAAVWALLDEPRAVDELVEEVVATFGISLSEAESGVEDAARLFLRLGILADDGQQPWVEAEVAGPPSDEARPLPRDHDP